LIKIPNARCFGTEISGNRQYNHEFSSEARAAILAKLEDGKSLRAIAREFNTTHSSIQYIKQHWIKSHTTLNSTRKGRAELLTEAEKRYIVRMAKKDRDISWNCIKTRSRTQVSARTIRRVVRRYFSRKWRALKRPSISKDAARQRLRFSYEMLPQVEEMMEVGGF
jgi:transposase-like protein